MCRRGPCQLCVGQAQDCCPHDFWLVWRLGRQPTKKCLTRVLVFIDGKQFAYFPITCFDEIIGTVQYLLLKQKFCSGGPPGLVAARGPAG